jgi:hypothetical protein
MEKEEKRMRTERETKGEKEDPGHGIIGREGMPSMRV